MSTSENPGRFERAVAAFDAANGEDPNRVLVSGIARPRELVDAERLSVWVDKIEPNAPEPLRLAARCQHLKRFAIARSTYPEGRIGYLEWRKALHRFHADEAEKVLRSVGYDDATIERVRAIVHKRSLKQDADVQTMEDALCLVFLEFEADQFATKHPAEKVVDILQKTWRKMSDRGHQAALGLSMSPALLGLVKRALGA